MQQFEFVIEEVREHSIVADGKNLLDAEENALEIYHKRAKTGTLIPHTIYPPKIVITERRK
jgi:hypothetical protein